MLESSFVMILSVNTLTQKELLYMLIWKILINKNQKVFDSRRPNMEETIISTISESIFFVQNKYF